MISKLNAFFYNSVLSETVKNKVERLILIVAIVSFFRTPYYHFFGKKSVYHYS